MKNYLMWILFVAVAVSLITSCSGPAGPVGAEGPPGTNGTSNIQFSTFTVAPILAPVGIWTTLGSPNPSGYSANLTVPAITSDTNLAVQVYYSLKSTNGPWTVMPNTNIFYTVSDSIDQLGFTWVAKTVTVVYNLMYPLHSVLPKNIIYFVVSVIPPVYMKRHPNVDWTNGSAVMHLPEVEAELHITNNK